MDNLCNPQGYFLNKSHIKGVPGQWPPAALERQKAAVGSNKATNQSPDVCFPWMETSLLKEQRALLALFTEYLSPANEIVTSCWVSDKPKVPGAQLGMRGHLSSHMKAGQCDGLCKTLHEQTLVMILPRAQKLHPLNYKKTTKSQQNFWFDARRRRNSFHSGSHILYYFMSF